MLVAYSANHHHVLHLLAFTTLHTHSEEHPFVILYQECVTVHFDGAMQVQPKPNVRFSKSRMSRTHGHEILGIDSVIQANPKW